MIARTLVIARREFAAYFATPLAAVFLVIFLFLAGLFTFNIGSFYERGQADLRPFFQFHPWLFLFLVPAVSMRLWAEERRTGTIEPAHHAALPPGRTGGGQVPGRMGLHAGGAGADPAHLDHGELAG